VDTLVLDDSFSKTVYVVWILQKLLLLIANV